MNSVHQVSAILMAVTHCLCLRPRDCSPLSDPKLPFPWYPLLPHNWDALLCKLHIDCNFPTLGYFSNFPVEEIWKNICVSLNLDFVLFCACIFTQFCSIVQLFHNLLWILWPMLSFTVCPLCSPLDSTWWEMCKEQWLQLAPAGWTVHYQWLYTHIHTHFNACK